MNEIFVLLSLIIGYGIFVRIIYLFINKKIFNKNIIKKKSGFQYTIIKDYFTDFDKNWEEVCTLYSKAYHNKDNNIIIPYDGNKFRIVFFKFTDKIEHELDEKIKDYENNEFINFKASIQYLRHAFIEKVDEYEYNYLSPYFSIDDKDKAKEWIVEITKVINNVNHDISLDSLSDELKNYSKDVNDAVLKAKDTHI